MYAFVSRRDFSAWGSFLMVGLWVLIGTMVLNFFFQNAAVDLWLASVTVLAVQRTAGVRHLAAAQPLRAGRLRRRRRQIYLDLLNMFMAILRIMGNRRN